MATKREEYIAKLKTQLDQWNVEMAKWESQAAQAQANMRAEYEKQLAAIRQRQDQAKEQTLNSSAVLLWFARKVKPKLGITGKNMGTGDYWTITSESTASFDIAFKNAAGAGVSRTFDAHGISY